MALLLKNTRKDTPGKKNPKDFVKNIYFSYKNTTK
jgi:hypothetical protein